MKLPALTCVCFIRYKPDQYYITSTINNWRLLLSAKLSNCEPLKMDTNGEDQIQMAKVNLTFRDAFDYVQRIS